MATVREELESFHQFAAERLSTDETVLSLDELLMQWADRRDRIQINDAIRQGIADVDAGRYEPADCAMEAIRREFGIPKA